MSGLAMSESGLDLSHHLCSEARVRKPNPMKAIWRLTRRKPNMVSLANGDPHFSLYPLRKMEFEVASVAEEDPVASWRLDSKGPSQLLTSTIDGPCALSLKTGLAYSNGAGLPEAQRAITELTNFYHSPPDHMATLTLGNSDGITKCFRLLGEPGDHFLTDEFAFSSVTNAALPQGINWVPVKMDEGGLIPEELENTMANWKPEQGRKPHVLYTVPCGQNPTGSTLSVERRKKIYALAQRFDLIIVEDDPYYFLQYDNNSEKLSADSPFMPSFLSMDVDGRVMRVDSFSKVMAPGMRLGWITSSAAFYEQLVSYTDSSTQHPHGFGQMLITEMLGAHGWGLGGFDKWVRSLRAEYHRRRDFCLELFEREVGATGFASTNPPEAGMFLWVRVNVEKHPRYRCDMRRGDQDGPQTNVAQLMEELFEHCLDDGLVVMPASIFACPVGPKHSDKENPIEDRLHYLRVTFAGTEDVMREGFSILGRVLKQFFTEVQK
ncbi:PLP-dependent transferase [Obba rivulosa]|uniref:PLP-dependent transferase n=1 Tax=Obba rivulosa TaxID=1052685 RepID=A0A8E2AQK2_9APHY|nr:PLP-dependent transferase [Obba rivulosa]